MPSWLAIFGKTGDKAIGKARLRHHSDTGGLERADGSVGEELSKGGRNTVDCDAVVLSVLVTNHVDRLLLEELVTAKLQSALQEVTGKGRTSTGQKWRQHLHSR
jgi:hypothetical protein